jgi:hypothetical protein
MDATDSVIRQQRKTIMKKIVFFITLMILFFTGMASAQWQAKFRLTGQQSDGQNICEVIIGAGPNAEILPEPPSPPQFTCRLFIPDSNWQSFHVKDIKQDSDTLQWVLAINPHGNIGPPVPASAVLSWKSNDFEKGSFEMREGYDGIGKVIVSDMNEFSELKVTGLDENQYFLILKK